MKKIKKCNKQRLEENGIDGKRPNDFYFYLIAYVIIMTVYYVLYRLPKQNHILDPLATVNSQVEK